MPTCTTTALLETAPSPCFSAQVLSPAQRIQMRIWFLANQLSVIGGNNYTNLLTSVAAGGLMKAQNDLFERATPPQLDQAWTMICYNNAVAAGAAISSSIQTLMTNIAPLQRLDMDTLEKMELTLLCQLGVSKAYPQ